MKLDLKTWVIVGLGIVIALLLLFDKDPEDDNAPLIAKIETREAAIHEMGRNYTALRTKMRQDSILYRDTIVSKQKEITQHKSNIKRLRSKPEVIEIVRLNPVIDTIFTYYDSVTTAQNFIIYSQEKQIAQMQVDINEMDRNFQFRLNEQAKNFEDQKAISQDYKKQLRKERRKGKLAKVLIPIVAVGAFLAGSSL